MLPLHGRTRPPWWKDRPLRGLCHGLSGQRLRLEEGEEDGGDRADDRGELSDPENEHPFDQIGTDGLEFRAKLPDLPGQVFARGQMLQPLGESAFEGLVQPVRRGLGFGVVHAGGAKSLVKFKRDSHRQMNCTKREFGMEEEGD